MVLPADVEAICVEYVAREAMMLSGQFDGAGEEQPKKDGKKSQPKKNEDAAGRQLLTRPLRMLPDRDPPEMRQVRAWDSLDSNPVPRVPSGPQPTFVLPAVRWTRDTPAFSLFPPPSPYNAAPGTTPASRPTPPPSTPTTPVPYPFIFPRRGLQTPPLGAPSPEARQAAAAPRPASGPSPSPSEPRRNHPSQTTSSASSAKPRGVRKPNPQNPRGTKKAKRELKTAAWIKTVKERKIANGEVFFQRPEAVVEPQQSVVPETRADTAAREVARADEDLRKVKENFKMVEEKLKVKKEAAEQTFREELALESWRNAAATMHEEYAAQLAEPERLKEANERIEREEAVKKVEEEAKEQQQEQEEAAERKAQEDEEAER